MTDRIVSMSVVPLALAGALLMGPGAVAAEAQREKAAENFMQADVDANGALTLSEFTTLIDLNAEDGIGKAATVKRFGRYATAFERLDANADKVITAAEIKALASR